MTDTISAATAAASAALTEVLPPAPAAAASSLTHFPADIKRRKLRVAIVTENFLPKVDGVTRTLARLLEHMNAEGHEAIVFGPETGLTSYSSYPVVGTFGVPLVVYPGLKLNFMRPRFIRRLQQFKPDIVHFVDPIWLGAQMLPAVQKWLPDVPCVSSYHTNLPTYATLFGLPWLEKTMWGLTRNLHDRCEINFCPSESTRRMLRSKGFSNVVIWGRGVYPEMFSPEHRDDNLRSSWGATPKPESLMRTPRVLAADDAASMHFAQRLGITFSSSSASNPSSPADESYIRSPPSFRLNPNSPSLSASPEFSPPPSYDSLAGIPAFDSGSFALPPPAMSEPTSSSSSSSSSDRVSSSHRASFSTRPILSAADQESKTVILYVGRMSWEKNLRFLVEAFRLLPDHVRAAAKLVFVGDGPARGDLTRLCQKFNLDAAFMGHQSGKRLAAMYASASVFAFPSFTETFGQVVLEALASGLPVVGLHAEGTSDLVYHGRTGLLLDVAAASKGTVSKSFEELETGKPVNVAQQEADASRDAKAEEATAGASSTSAISGTQSSSTSSRISNVTVPGLPAPIPSIIEFSYLTSTSHPAFLPCATAYAQLLEQLISDRVLRAEMGRRAREMACKRTWWAAMEECIGGYEAVLVKEAQKEGERKEAIRKRLSDEELERVRERERCASAPLTGPIVKAAVLVYLILFMALWYFVLLA
ncbi:unnamed protein product [Tilletia laevis]|uniref:Glycosyltransferase subfamily 4-like N-terminal domain-containing protein n=2 Tax=Tilletia TaxID=13289 RepID=A0A177UGV4_9BASI|nr:hypothetical protein CF336_g3076 [Tilletia laevis]KAE8262457.1 hypothetical protein A4X03_0g2440 [Tilletia caries]CAD6897552.1 unnamed protein product [Tilletia controversa]KAE8205667.1 hypothetical protein CF335_g2224 [Tilletia laevis]CAD6888989.1 unnamed protein product [Tilletia caries]